MVGPAEEFGAIGYNDAKPGGLFVKPGIGGSPARDETPYNHSKPYDIANGGKWDVTRRSDSIEFRHTLNEPAIGFGYVYTKVIRLTKGQPQMTIEHVLKNTGTKPIVTNVYNHNFMTLDQQPPGPDYEISFPFQLQRAQRGARARAPRARPRAASRAGRPPATLPGPRPPGGPSGGRSPIRRTARAAASRKCRRWRQPKAISSCTRRCWKASSASRRASPAWSGGRRP